MKMTDLLAAELEREAAVTRRTLERVPDGCYGWRPHEKSMTLGYLAELVANMPSWVVTMVNQDELDMKPADGSTEKPQELRTSRELVEAFDANISKAHQALANTTDQHLMTPWRFVVGGRVVSEQPRHIMLRDGVFNHLVHHRGQLTVYLRLNNARVPSVYGPSGDERGW